MNIQTDRQIKIFCKQGQYGNMYSTGISKRLEDGTYLNAYIPVKFKKGTEPNGETNIYIRNAWLFPTKDLKINIFINEYELVEDVAHRELNNEEVSPEDFVTYTSDDLPF